ncbi:hypothetical protein BDE18_3353 [Paracoccus pantotrophus]|uniref:Uncharacterized protein n=1 Tax=Paracoccus pantotrophus TaxID=82367 RepID=A0A495P3C2_PARPN|nr:hypothetical protein [Paracoccus pantotrophus]QFG35298.1 hypothetical protein ESD82_03660 [Paracoccus pantotrophus]QLH15876.1 hypothetical protein HYQ43_17235 [Paracoccus pantotrophus]RKS44505.1 hypothetical protein BDE18_3353 [Paracoccus pantotrophus]
MSHPVELMSRDFAGGMPEMMANYLRALALHKRVLAEVPAIGNMPLAFEIRDLLDAAERHPGNKKL